MAVKITDLKEQLMKKINADDVSQVEKVERYIDLVKSFRKIHAIILKEGETVVTENGAQRFVKAHPLLGRETKLIPLSQTWKRALISTRSQKKSVRHRETLYDYK